MARNTTHICDDILHVSHHGSINGADLDFIKKCAPQYTVISTACGVHENIPHKEVYRTDQGTITWTF